jgi:GNAT superfamily N-acetyltransferase
MRVEPAAVADLPRLLEIRHAAFAAQAPAVYSPEEVATLLRDVDPAELRMMIMETQLFVARADQDIAGLAGWHGDRLRHVYVSPAYGRRGWGSVLVRHAERDFRARSGHRTIKAGVVLYAEGFYRSLGYELVRRAVAWDGSGYLEMRRDVAE